MAGRPKMKEGKQRRHVSLSLSPDVCDMAERTENQSRFFEKSVMSMAAISALLEKADGGEIKPKVALEDIRDMAIAWASQFEESVPIEAVFPKAAKG